MLGWILVCITIGWVGELSGPDVWLGWRFAWIANLVTAHLLVCEEDLGRLVT